MASSFAFILFLVGLSSAARYFAGVLVTRILSGRLDSFEIEDFPACSLSRGPVKNRLHFIGLSRQFEPISQVLDLLAVSPKFSQISRCEGIVRQPHTPERFEHVIDVSGQLQ